MREAKELLTKQIVEDYQKKVAALNEVGYEDIGQRRVLKNELMERCNVTELEAINILNGYHVQDYIYKYEIRSGKVVIQKDEERQSTNRKLLEELAELETLLRLQEMLDKELS